MSDNINDDLDNNIGGLNAYELSLINPELGNENPPNEQPEKEYPKWKSNAIWIYLLVFILVIVGNQYLKIRKEQKKSGAVSMMESDKTLELTAKFQFNSLFLTQNMMKYAGDAQKKENQKPKPSDASKLLSGSDNTLEAVVKETKRLSNDKEKDLVCKIIYFGELKKFGSENDQSAQIAFQNSLNELKTFIPAPVDAKKKIDPKAKKTQPQAGISKELKDNIILLYEQPLISKEKADEIKEQIKKADFGWFGTLADAQAYKSSGQTELYNKTYNKITKSPMMMMIVLIVVGCAALPVCVGGIVVIFYYFLKIRKRRTEPMQPIIAEQPKHRADSLAGAFAIYLTIYFGLSLIPEKPGLSDSLSGSMLGIALLISVLIVIPSFIWLFLFAGGKGFKLSQIGLRTDSLGKDILWGLGGYMALAAVFPIVIGITVILSKFAPGQTNSAADAAMNITDTSGVIFLLLLGSVYAPIVEEIFFRGALFQSLWHKTGKMVLSAIIAGCVFAILHEQFLTGIVAITTIAVINSIIYAERRSLIPAIILHAINNGIVLLLIIFLFKFI